MSGLVLYQVGPGLGLPSKSAHCLQFQAFLKFCGLSYSLKSCSPSSQGSDGLTSLPAVKNNLDLVERENILSYVKTKLRKDPDASLDEKARADVAAYVAFVEERAFDATLYFWWADKRNYADVVSRAFGADLPFPASQLWPWQERRRVMALLDHKGLNEKSVVERLRSLYQALDKRLGAGPYFFGQILTSLDAAVFGHLSCHLFVDLPNNTLRSTIEQFPNLVTFLHTVRNVYFGGFLNVRPVAASEPLLPPALHSRPTPPTAPARTPEEEAQRQSSRNFAILMGVSVVGYLLFSNLIRVGSGSGGGGGDGDADDDEADDDDEDDQ